jgi:hypothetical protein
VVDADVWLASGAVISILASCTSRVAEAVGLVTAITVRNGRVCNDHQTAKSLKKRTYMARTLIRSIPCCTQHMSSLRGSLLRHGCRSAQCMYVPGTQIHGNPCCIDCMSWRMCSVPACSNRSVQCTRLQHASAEKVILRSTNMAGTLSRSIQYCIANKRCR